MHFIKETPHLPVLLCTILAHVGEVKVELGEEQTLSAMQSHLWWKEWTWNVTIIPLEPLHHSAPIHPHSKFNSIFWKSNHNLNPLHNHMITSHAHDRAFLSPTTPAMTMARARLLEVGGGL